MKKVAVFLLLIMMSMISVSCGPKGDDGFDRYWVTSAKMNIHKSAKPASDILGELKFGDEVLGHESNLGALIPAEWIEIKYGDGYGYVTRANLCDKETMDQLKALVDGANNGEAQASGETGKKTPLRVGPSRTSKLIESLKQPTKIEIFERAVVDRADKDESRKEVWYKVRLEDGRVGYIHSNNLKLITPGELNQYTTVRQTVAWRELREREDATSGKKGKEYIVAYLSQGTPVDADYSRIELYMFDPKSGLYSTALAKGGLLGKFPLSVKDAGDGKKLIEIRQISQKKPEKIIIQEYSFPNPIKMVRQYEVDK